MLEPIKLKDLMETEYEEAQWLVQDLVPAGGITILSGQPGSYKTWLLQEIGKQVASGKPVFNKFATTKGNVLFIDEENIPGLLKMRFQLLGTTQQSGIFLSIKGGFKADDENDIARVVEFIKANNITLVCIDSLIRIHTGDENAATQMATLFNALGKLTAIGTTLLLTHHHRKPSGQTESYSTKLRGSSDILAAIDCHLAVKVDKAENMLTLFQEKLRNAPEMQPIDLKISVTDTQLSFVYQGTNSTEDKGIQIGKKILDLLKEGPKSRAEINEALVSSYGIAAIGEALRELKEFELIGISKKGLGGKHSYFLSEEEYSGEESDSQNLEEESELESEDGNIAESQEETDSDNFNENQDELDYDALKAPF